MPKILFRPAPTPPPFVPPTPPQENKVILQIAPFPFYQDDEVSIKIISLPVQNATRMIVSIFPDPYDITYGILNFTGNPISQGETIEDYGRDNFEEGVNYYAALYDSSNVVIGSYPCEISELQL